MYQKLGLLLMAFSLSACTADMENLVNDTFELVNMTGTLAGSVANATPTQICNEVNQNPLNAKNKYVGKTIRATGKVLGMYESNTMMSASADKYNISLKSGSTTMAVGLTSSMVARSLKNGQTVTMKGRISSVTDSSGRCFIIMRNAIVDTGTNK
ncbi:OB-fold protein [Alysiella crassa]|uniref:tRNA_anti-like n=1 Tax=Alysiella crassa TaxID=153491 RepID=A0A376BKV9_9NEIS|nr:hypothetical protein [Alysiella crassa]UOP07522.1 hypothetical protein LVJ80_03705 [Alysiella crassa]SSY70278.1 tRNA_anti-like [Alysiella crassa]